MEKCEHCGKEYVDKNEVPAKIRLKGHVMANHWKKLFPDKRGKS